jgi:hypothetical protein
MWSSWWNENGQEKYSEKIVRSATFSICRINVSYELIKYGSLRQLHIINNNNMNKCSNETLVQMAHDILKTIAVHYRDVKL